MSRSEQVMELVRSKLEKNPDVETREWYERAKGADASIEELSLRQLNACYPLQVKREMGRGGDGAGGRGQEKREPEGSETNVEREAIRQGLLRLARDVAGAEDKPEMIDVLTGVEAYVDEVDEALDLWALDRAGPPWSAL